MKIILFVILAVFVLLALAAIRYRKQINAIIGVGRMIRDARTRVRPQREIPASKTAAARELVSCASCGTWVPRERAIRFDAKTFYCTRECVKVSMTVS